MANITLELIWIRNLLAKIDFPPEYPMRLYVGNKTTIHTTENEVFYERTKHIELDCHIVRMKLEKKIIITKHVSSDIS